MEVSIVKSTRHGSSNAQDSSHRLVWLFLFAVSFAWVEASVVVYLRALYYPGGFFFPLKPIAASHIGVELVREFATIVMLAAVGILAGRSRWQRFACFAIAFGVWDLFFYLWLKVVIGWPASLLEWDILFLLPSPWIAPVLAPILISFVLIGGGGMILRVERSRPFRAPVSAWILAVAATVLVLWTFMRDTDVGTGGAMPLPYAYIAFFLSVVMYSVSLRLCWTSNPDPSELTPTKSSP